ncbi:MAG: EVE domain-containing protein [Legionellaceae bacterium]|nr:EVE domain-containing protein [Legionellaceae bacterium]
MTNFWLMKSEPNCYSIDDLSNAENQTDCWDGVRNYQARNFMRDSMCIHDKIFFYHSSCKTPGIVGIAEVASKPYPDYTAQDPTSDHPDCKSTPENPIWYMVDVRFIQKLPNIITLTSLKQYPELANFKLLQKGNRLSILPVSEYEWNFILGIDK